MPDETPDFPLPYPFDPFCPRDRESVPQHDRWIIDRILPEYEISLIAGPSGVGKTTAAFDWLSMIQNGQDVFSRRVYPTKFVVVSLDRSESAHIRMLTGMGIPPDRFAFLSLRGYPTTIRDVIQGAAAKFPDHPGIFIDGIATLVAGGKLSDYGETSKFLAEGGATCERCKRTIIGTVHSTKTKEGEHYSNPRQRILGSVAWAAYADLIITIDPLKADDPSNLVRLVNILPRNSAEFSFKLVREGARLIPWTDPHESDLLSILDYWLTKQDTQRQIPTSEFILIGSESAISDATVERWIKSQVESGMLTRTARGKYQRPGLSAVSASGR